MLAALEWLGVLIFIIFAVIRLFTKNADEEESRPLPTVRPPRQPRRDLAPHGADKPQRPPPPPQPTHAPAQPYSSPPPPPLPVHQDQAPNPEQQIRNFLQDLQKRMAEQQQPVATPPPPRVETRKPKTEVLVIEEETVAEAFPEEAPYHSDPAYDLEIAPVWIRQNLTFDRESIQKAFVMREVLGAPRADNPY